MNSRHFAPIECGKVAPAPSHVIASLMEPAAPPRLNLKWHEDEADEMGKHGEQEHCYRMRQRELENEVAAEAGEDVRELLAQRPASTPNGPLVGIISDLVAALQGMLSHGDAGDRTRAVLALKKAGVR